MSLHAVVYMSSPGLVLAATSRDVPDAVLEVDHQSNVDSGFVSARADDFEAVKRALDADPTLENVRIASEYGQRRVYQFDFAIERELFSEKAADLGINVRSMRSEQGEPGWTVDMILPSREALIEIRKFCVERNLGFELRRLSRDAAAGEESFGLSPKQREALLTAYDNGYFEVPRGISQQELADLVGTSPTAVSQRLRRATDALIATTIGRDERAAPERTTQPENR